MEKLEFLQEEGELLLKILENYHAHLELEIHRTSYRDFRKALESREKKLSSIIEKVKGAYGATN